MRPGAKFPAFLPFLPLLLLPLHASRASAAWPAGGRLVSPIPSPSVEYRVASIAADGGGGATIAWVRSVNDPDPYYSSASLHAQHLTVFGDLPAGWTPDGISLGGWSPTGTVERRIVLPLITDGAGGAHQPLLQSQWGPGQYVDAFWLVRLLANGSDEWVGSGWFGLASVTAAATDADGSGGMVYVAQQQTYGVPGEPAPPRHLYVQRVDAAGAPLWPPAPDAAPGPVLVPPGQQRPQWGLAAASDGGGGAFFAWVDGRDATGGPGGTEDRDLYVQHILADGSIAPGWPAGGVGVCTVVGHVEYPRLAHVGAGSVFVAWEDHRGPQVQVYAACLDASGALAPGCPVDGRPLGDPAYHAESLGLIADGVGGAYVLRGDILVSSPAAAARTYLHRLQPDGLPAPGWPPGGRTLGAGLTSHPAAAVCGDGSGGAFVEFWDGPGPSSPSGVYALHVAADGTNAPGWSGGPALLGTTGGPPLGIDGSTGSAIACWTDSRHPEGPTVYAHRLQPDGPVAIAVSLESAQAWADRAIVRWHVADGAGLRVTVARRAETGEWLALESRLPDGAGRVEVEDRAIVAGTRYGYRLEYEAEGESHVAGEVWLAIPASVSFGLDPPHPNPVQGTVELAVRLDREGPATLELMDIAGRRVAAREIANGPGRHVIELAPSGRIPTGLYFARLTQDGRADTRRLIVSR